MTGKASTDQLWADSLAYLRAVLTYNTYVENVARLTVRCTEESIALFAPNDAVRARIAELVIPLLAERLAPVTVSLSVGPDGALPADALRPGVWARCLSQLSTELSEQQLNTWVRPLQAIEGGDTLRLLAPNRFVIDWFDNHLRDRLQELVVAIVDGEPPRIVIELGNRMSRSDDTDSTASPIPIKRAEPFAVHTRLNTAFTFDTFIEGSSNQLARAAAYHASEQVGKAYNPLFIYGGVGLGKTHLMQAIGNRVREFDPTAKITYVHSERFVSDMVRGLQHNTIGDFKKSYRTLDVLLLDDIQFFAGKNRSQEEFFHTFDALLEGQRQIVLTCDRYPKEVSGLEDRLKSRFGWGLTVAIEPPDVETSVAILMSKAAAERTALPEEVAFFLSQRIRSNVRELEGALRRVLANARFTGQPITVDFAKEALRDVLALQARLVSVDNIQRTVAEYFRIRVATLIAKDRRRSIVRPRQLAMALAKELTQHSLPEIGDMFGGRDNTTVLHACRTIRQLRESDAGLAEDYSNLLRTLTA